MRVRATTEEVLWCFDALTLQAGPLAVDCPVGVHCLGSGAVVSTAVPSIPAPFAVPAFDIPSYPLFVEEEEIFPTYEFFDDLTVDCNSLSCNIRDWS